MIGSMSAPARPCSSVMDSSPGIKLVDEYRHFGFLGANPWTFLILLFVNFIVGSLGEVGNEVDLHLGVEQIVSLSRASKRFNGYFSHFVDKFLRDTFHGKKFLSVAKVVSVLTSNPFMDLRIRNMLESYILSKHRKAKQLITRNDKIAPTLQSFWQGPYYFATAFNRVTVSSFDAWVNRYQFVTNQTYYPSENEFLLMVASQQVQVNSVAIVYATFCDYSLYCFDFIDRRLGGTNDHFDYQDVVAALAIPWYNPECLAISFKKFLICTHEILWNIVIRGSSPENDSLLLMFLEKPMVDEIQWTFYDKSGATPVVVYSLDQLKSHPKFTKIMIKSAKKHGFSKHIRKVLKNKLKHKID